MKVFVCGDVVNYKNKNGIICSEEMSSIIQKADLSICNFEAPVHSNEHKLEKSGGHHSQEEETIIGLKQQGFNMLCLANNHIMDFGSGGLSKTLDLIKTNNLEYLGAGLKMEEIYRPIIIKQPGYKLGIINAGEAQFGVADYYSEEEAGYAWINHHLIDEMILELKKECDKIILLAHCGLENVNIPQKEWRIRYKHLCNLGVDIVIGSHPHVPQGYEKHKKSIIFYSLGNFYFDSSNFEDKRDDSFSILLELTGKDIEFELIFHHKENNKVVRSNKDEEIDINRLNSLLGENYERRNIEISEEIYEKFIKKSLTFSLNDGLYDGGLVSSCKRILKRMLFGKKENKKYTMIHLLRNESYSYATRTVLSNLIKKETS